MSTRTAFTTNNIIFFFLFHFFIFCSSISCPSFSALVIEEPVYPAKLFPMFHIAPACRAAIKFPTATKVQNPQQPFGFNSVPEMETFSRITLRHRCLILINSNTVNLCYSFIDLCKLGCFQNHDREPWDIHKGAKEKNGNC